MRDNVSKLGTCYTGLGALPVFKTTQTSASVDLAPYNAATVYIVAGTWTDGTHTFQIQESSDNSTFTAVNSTDLVAWSATSATNFYPAKQGNAQPTAISSAATAVNQRIGYIGGMRYLRVVTTVTGSPVTGAAYDVFIITGEPRVLPASV
jgi:hypothetical protein